MKIGIIGSREYQNFRKVKDTIFELKKKFGNELMIVSGGCRDGADKFAKKFAIELGCSYIEFNPAHTPKNLYSALSENYYGKIYQPKNFFHRNKMIAKYCDYIIAFVPKGAKSNGTEHTIKEAKKIKKSVVIIS
jgi:predicted Rossmann fold nucleotide-binding protein DprA/Smf involved in DNA uptake|tara:strand:+ start:193 stop:594 length:402 start_codon:yes stop_codon:yes gene_type:complete